MSDGLGWSLAATVVLPERGTVEASITYPPPTGIVLELVDERGTRVFDADVVLPESKDGRRSGAVTAAKYTAPRFDETGQFVETAIPLRPGRYSVLVKRSGFAWSSAPVEVAEGTLSRAVVHLLRAQDRR